MLNFVVLLLVIAYLVAGIASMVRLHRTDEFEMIWSMSAAFWLFLAVGMLRLSQIARTITVTLMWICVLVLPFGIVDPTNLTMFLPEGHGHSPLALRMAAIPLVCLSAIGLMVLGKNRNEFR